MKILSTKERLVYGINPVNEVIRAKKKMIFLYVQKGKEVSFRDVIKYAQSHSATIEFQDKSFFDKSLPKGNQGIACRIIDKQPMSIEGLLSNSRVQNRPFFFIVLDGIEDPRNLGAIIRIADSTGVDAIIHQTHRSASHSGYLSKSSAGAIEYVNIIETPNIKNVIEYMKENGILIYGSDQSGSETLWDVDFQPSLALLIGSEGKGMRDSVRKLCDNIVSIPMLGNINSLNVSVATGVLCYEVLRQRKKTK
ncbi:MAG: 23S rRNA (guanosine(2251)-2'-O)-methyltransferase RlmB [Thermodesulfovibrionales bacterium]